MNKKILFLIILLPLLSTFVSADINNSVLFNYECELTSNTVLYDTLENISMTSANSQLSTTQKKFDNKSCLMSVTTGQFFSASHTISYPLSINYWVYTDLSGALSYPIYWGNEATTIAMYHSIASDGLFKLTYGHASGNSDTYSTPISTIPVNTWTMVSVVINADDDVNIYIDGVNQSLSKAELGTAILPTGSNPFKLGQAGQYPQTNELYMDAITSWQGKALTQQEVTDIYSRELQYPFAIINDIFEITSKSFWDDSTINDFSAYINGSIYNTTNGTIITSLLQNDSNLYNITIFSDDWLNTTYNNYNISSNLIGYMNQSIINFSVKGVYSNTTITNYTLEIDGINNSVVNDSIILNPNADNYTVKIYDNTGLETFIVQNNPIIINALDNKSYEILVSDHLISVNAVDYLGATINTFNATVTNINLSLTETKNTTTGNILFNASEYSYTVSIDAEGYAYTEDINLTVINPNQTFYANFTLYPTNSVNFTFYYENTPLIITNGTNISFDLINGGALTYNTSVGWKWIENLTSADYEIRYMSDGFDSRSYFFTVSDRSTQLLTFYLSNSTLTTNYIIRVADLSDKDVSNAIVRLQRQYVDFNGSYKTIEECKTDDNGECDLFIEESSEIVYRFIILVNDEIVKTTNPQNIVNIAGVTTKKITIQIDIGTSIFEAYETNSNLFSDLNFGSNISNYSFIDGNNELVSGCLKITRRGLHSATGTIVSNVCESGSTGDISTNYTSYIVNNTVLVFEGTANYNTYSVTLEKAEINFISKGVNSDSNDDLLLTVFIIIILVLASILVKNIYIQLSILFIGLYAVSWIGFNKLGVTTIIILGFVTIIMNYNNRNTSGGQQL